MMYKKTSLLFCLIIMSFLYAQDFSKLQAKIYSLKELGLSLRSDFAEVKDIQREARQLFLRGLREYLQGKKLLSGVRHMKIVGDNLFVYTDIHTQKTIDAYFKQKQTDDFPMLIQVKLFRISRKQLAELKITKSQNIKHLSSKVIMESISVKENDKRIACLKKAGVKVVATPVLMTTNRTMAKLSLTSMKNHYIKGYRKISVPAIKGKSRSLTIPELKQLPREIHLHVLIDLATKNK